MSRNPSGPSGEEAEEDGSLLAWLFGSLIGQAVLGLVIVIAALGVLGTIGAIAWFGLAGEPAQQLAGGQEAPEAGSTTAQPDSSESDVLGNAGVNLQTNCVGNECEVSMDVRFGKADRIAVTCANPIASGEPPDFDTPEYNSDCVPQSDTDDYIVDIDANGRDQVENISVAGGEATTDPLYTGNTSSITVWAFVEGERYTLFTESLQG